MIYLLSDPIHTGKTSAIMNWADGKNNVGGFVSPDISNQRVLKHMTDDETFIFQVDADNYPKQIISVGRYTFAQSGFDQATQWALADMDIPTIKYIIIDEIGKLELIDQGFAELVNQILKKKNRNKNIILVIRDTLVYDVIDRFGISDHQMINKDDLILLL